MNESYNVKNDAYYQAYIKNKHNIVEDTEDKYVQILNKLTKATNKTIEEIIISCKNEQEIITIEKLPPDANGNERKREIRFDVNNKDSLINQYINQYVEYCKSRDNKNTTINNEMGMIMAFFRGNSVELPKWERLEDDSEPWNMLSKEDLNYVLKDMTLVHQSLLHFLIATGMRIGDCLKLTIGDFMKATSDYHDCLDVEDFIDNAPDDMIGKWSYTPSKTKRHKIKHVTFNTTTSSNIILQNLRHIKDQYIPRKNMEEGANIKIRKDYALFGSKKDGFETPMRAQSVAELWRRKNAKLKKFKIAQIQQKIKNGEMNEEDYDEEIKKIGKFHPHSCRKFYETTISKNCSDLRKCAILEGHANPMKTDKHYIKKTIEELKDTYLNAHDDLCLSKVETRIVSNKETEEMNKKISESNAKVETLTNEINEKNKQIALLQEQVENQSEKMKETSEILNQIKNKTDKNYIRKTIKQHFHENQRKEILQRSNTPDDIMKCFAIEDLAYEYAIKEGFEETSETINKYINKAIVQCNLHPEIIENMYEKGTSYDREMTENMQINSLFYDIYEKIKQYEDILPIIENNEEEFKSIFFKNIHSSEYNINEITDEDENKIIESVIMEYIS